MNKSEFTLSMQSFSFKIKLNKAERFVAVNGDDVIASAIRNKPILFEFIEYWRPVDAVVFFKNILGLVNMVPAVPVPSPVP